MPRIGSRGRPGGGSVARRILRNTLANAGGQGATMLVWFALTPFILDRLGPTRFALWAVVSVFLTFGRLLDLGVGLAISKYVAELRAREDDEQASNMIAAGLRMYCGIGVVVVLLIIPLALVAPDVINVPEAERDTLRWLVVVAGVAVALQLPATTAFAVLEGLQRFDLIKLVSTAATLATAAAVTVILLLGGGVVALAAVNIPLILLWQVPAIRLVRRVAPGLRFGWRGARWEHVRTLAGFSWSLVILHASSLAKRTTDELVIGAVLSVDRVTPYALARRIGDVPPLVAYQFAQVLMPVASDLHARGDHAGLRALTLTSTRIALAVFIPIGAGLTIFAGPLLGAWVGDRYAGGDDIVALLIGAGLIDVLLWPLTMVLQGMARHRPLAWFAAISTIVNLGLSIVLVGSVGITGAAVGTLVATVLEAALVLPYALSASAIGLRPLIAEGVLPAVLPGLVAVAALVAIRDLLDPATLPALAVAGAAGVLIYVGAYLAWPPNAADRARVMRAARDRRR